jgi:hypothetical protein
LFYGAPRKLIIAINLPDVSTNKLILFHAKLQYYIHYTTIYIPYVLWQAAHNCFIATTTVPGLFLLSTDDPSSGTGKADIQGSSGAKDQETTKLVEADSPNETTLM